jgi:ribulose bisphosphate carboxylase small subunit
MYELVWSEVGRELIYSLFLYFMMWKMAAKLMECIVDKISLLKKGKKPAVEYAENRFSIVKMWDGKEEKVGLTDEQREKLSEIEKMYNRQ